MDHHSSSVVSSPSQRTPSTILNSHRSSSLPLRQLQSSQRQAGEAHQHQQAGSQPPPLHHHQRQRYTDSKSPSPSPAVGVGRFTEEWDASQRGSSIIDESYRLNVTTMQRSTSVTSFVAGDDDQLPVRNNTLKKKASMGRSSSLRRSSSRRSNRAGSVRSLALHSASDPEDAHSAFHCPVPTSGTPTDVLATRFQSE